VKESL